MWKANTLRKSLQTTSRRLTVCIVTDFVSSIYNLKAVLLADFVSSIYNLKTVCCAAFNQPPSPLYGIH
ncbi:hypothetical protein AZJ59_03400 [Streptococcus pneumoniae]|nr:hypothetical protein AZJ59_03400 [Streptococcus pneumoniae]